MTEQRIFSDRENAFEAKYVQDEETTFRLTARRDRLMWEWAITEAALDEESAGHLRHDIVALHGGPDHDNEVIDLVAVALAGAGLSVNRAAVAQQLVACGMAARQG